ncbi:MAG: hypothetical protein ACYSWW_08215 [Planctomycetota bacterium]|jgi:hypothetical protein
MKSLAQVERLVKKFRLKPTVKMREKTLTDALKAQEEIMKTESAVTRPNIWRIIMKTKLSKLTAAAIAIACLVPLCYGVGKLVTTVFIVDEVVVTYPDEKNGGGSGYGWRAGVMTNESLSDEEIAKKIKEYNNDPNNVRRKEEMKQIFKELHELRQAGTFERTFVKEDEQDGIKIRFYQDHFTLSSGKTITMDIQESWKDGKLIGAGGGWGGGGGAAAESWGGKETRTEKK